MGYCRNCVTVESLGGDDNVKLCPVHDVGGLTPEEKALIEKVAGIWSDFIQLPRYHPADLEDVEFHIHALQNIFMSRVAVRAHPELFPVRDPKPEALHG